MKKKKLTFEEEKLQADFRALNHGVAIYDYHKYFEWRKKYSKELMRNIILALILVWINGIFIGAMILMLIIRNI